MIGSYVDAVSHALGGALEVANRFALPLAVALGLGLIAAAVYAAWRRDDALLFRIALREAGVNLAGYLAAGLVILTAWAALGAMKRLAEEDLEWRQSAQATANPTPDAPPVIQYGPTAAALIEHTYSRTLTLPPDFLQRVGDQGVGVLAPYLNDPSASDVLRLADTFRQSGKDVVFTREMTRMAEEPIPFALASVRVRFKRLQGQAYDALMEATYAFSSARAEPAAARFQFVLPASNTLRDLSVTLDGRPLAEPIAGAPYEWRGQVLPGERHEAKVRYRVTGARTWSYDFGSLRRRVQQFRLDAETDGPVKFLRGSLKPTGSTRGGLTWDLANVVTAQQIAIALPPDAEREELLLQALTALPASPLLLLAGFVAAGLAAGSLPSPARITAAAALTAGGLGAAAALSPYLGPVTAFLLAPLAGALLAVRALGRTALAVVPAALLPAAFLSAQNSGLIVVGLLLASLALTRAVPASRRARPGR